MVSVSEKKQLGRESLALRKRTSLKQDKEDVQKRVDFEKSPKTLSPWDVAKILLQVGAIYVCFLSQGLIQEDIYANVDKVTGAKFKSPIFLVGLVCFGSFLLGVILNNSGVTKESDIFQRRYFLEGRYRLRTIGLMREGFIISISYVLAMVASNFSLTRVNYPTQVLVKSAKALPVIIGGYFLYGKRYPFSDYLMVAVVTISLLVFQFENVLKTSGRGAQQQSLVGFLALFMSLLFDGMTGPRQDRLVADHDLGTGDIMTLINLFGAPICLVASLLVEGKTPYLQARANLILIPKIISFVLCGAAGQVFIVEILRRLGSLHLTLITTTRKFFAILISVLWFRHSLSGLQWAAVAGIFSSGFFKYILREEKTQKKTGRRN